MAEITNKRKGELLRGLFSILGDHPEGLKASEALKKLQVEVPPTQFEASEYPNRPGIRRYEKIVRFSTVKTVKAGWLVKSKGIWALTDSGREAYTKIVSPEEFSKEASKLYRSWKKNQDQEENLEIDDQDLQTNISYELALENSWSEIEDHVASLPPYDVQNRLIPGLLEGMGYHVIWKAPEGPDDGIDVIAHSDPLGINGPTIKVSVRRREKKADVKDIREFLSCLNGNDVGIFFSVSGYTKDAEREARNQSRTLRLLDLEAFFHLWVENHNKINDVDKQLLPIRPVWFLAYDNDDLS